MSKARTFEKEHARARSDSEFQKIRKSAKKKEKKKFKSEKETKFKTSRGHCEAGQI